MLKKVILAVVIMTAFFIAIGSLGAYSAENITALRCAVTCGICAVAEGVALKIINQ